LLIRYRHWLRLENLPPFSERNGSGIDDNIGISGSILRQAVEKAIDIVDASTLEVILENLTKKGIDLDNPSSRYTLEQLETALTDIFGVEAGPLLIDRVRMWLEQNGH
jgi:hypothetical protein